MGIFNKPIEFLAKEYVNSIIKEYGEVINLKIDSKKIIDLEVLLKGEKENIFIKIEKYEIVSINGSHYIKFKNVIVSREWLEVLIQNVAIPSFAPQKMFEIDSTYAKIIDVLI